MHNPNNLLAGPADEPGRGLTSPLARRSFLRYSGAGLAIGGLWLAGCSKDDDTDVNPNGNFIDVGKDDTGILNYAYALEQLEAAFYTQVVGSFYTGATATEQAILKDIKDHEISHREFFKRAITSGRISDSLQPDFSNIDFTQRTTTSGKLGVLQAAMAFEDLGVAAYNGAGRFITNNDYLTLAGKIVSVEARHAALIRELIKTNSFVANDVVNLDTSTPNNLGGSPAVTGNLNGTGLERSKRPAAVLTTANTFLAAGSKLSATQYPA
ncbi:ferritin-like domain-containing protein [Hymenobacter ruricola]|uniref:Ferritin-like domain-containing protein n=1 Tax=Hymenobacter ruricola TaxID=2791023 RepID=A0ABS0I3G3_9BACT|nr:ferritin-like domain-containing protein [Hymenobacter ruricola]MBF9221486.1 ferritin-like domain-containing protein [Hymenobacter ruricola]